MPKSANVIIVVFGITGIIYANAVPSPVSYDGYSVYEVFIKNEEDAKIVSQLKGEPDINFWTEIGSMNRTTDIMVSPEMKKKFEKVMEGNNLKYNIIIEDFGKIKEHPAEVAITKSTTFGNCRGNSYLKYSEMLECITQFTSTRKNAPQVWIEKIGRSYEKRNIYMIKISSDRSKKKPIILIDAGIHAREWVVGPTALYIMYQLIYNYTANQDTLKNVDYYIIPMVNPDGYEYSRTHDRMWRKTRSKQEKCFGVDANRNYDFFWGVSGTSPDPCNDIYKGPIAFSEIEAQNIRNVGLRYQERILGYVSFHAYGPYLLYPWGYSPQLPADWKQMDICAKAFVDAVEEFSGTRYSYGSSSRVLYEASGGSDDYFKGELGVTFAYTLELPGSSREGFVVDPKYLPFIGAETFHGMKALTSCFWRLLGEGMLNREENNVTVKEV